MINKFFTAAYKINLHIPRINSNALTVTNSLFTERKSQSEGGGGGLEVRDERLGDERQDAAATERVRERVRARRCPAEDGGRRRLAVIANPLPLRIKNLITPSECTMCTHINSFNYRVRTNLVTGDASVVPQSPYKLQLARNVHYIDHKLLVIIDTYYLWVSYFAWFTLPCHS